VSTDTPPEVLHHYTDRVGLVGIMESKTLWATDIRHLNDESEVRYSRDLLGALAERFRQEQGDSWAARVVCEAVAALASAPTSPDTFVASLCDDGDNLGQWRGYGGHGQGFAVGFDRERLRVAAQAQDYSLIRLIYEQAAQEAQLEKSIREAIEVVARWGVDRASAPPAIDQLLSLGVAFTLVTLCIKNPYFKDEREWRLARVIVAGLSEGRSKARTRAGVDVPYEEVTLVDATDETPIVEVVLGPMARSDAIVAEVRDLLDRSNLEHIPIRKSVGPLRA
jgi:hypothetical protein